MSMIIMPAEVDSNFIFEDELYEAFSIAKANHLKVTFQLGSRPGPWSVQGPDSLAPVYGGPILIKCIGDCLEDYDDWRRGVGKYHGRADW